MSLTYSIGILGKLNIASLRSGLQQTKESLKETDSQAKKSGESIGRFQKGVTAGLGALQRMSFAAAGALTAIGLTAPALSGPMAKIRNELFKTTDTIGKNLKPGFERFAELWGSFNQFLDNNPTFTKIGSNILGLLGTVGLLSGGFKAFKWVLSPVLGGLGKLATKLGITGVVSKLGTAFSGFVVGAGAKFVGWLAAIPGMIPGIIAGIGALGGQALQWLGEKIGLLDPRGTGGWDVAKRIGTNALGGAAAGAGAGALIGALGGPVGAGAGALIGGAGGLLFSGGKEIYNAATGTGAYAQASSPNQNINLQNNISIDGRQLASSTSQYMSYNMSYTPMRGQ